MNETEILLHRLKVIYIIQHGMKYAYSMKLEAIILNWLQLHPYYFSMVDSCTVGIFECYRININVHPLFDKAINLIFKEMGI
jgi:hypothetical protein